MKQKTKEILRIILTVLDHILYLFIKKSPDITCQHPDHSCHPDTTDSHPDESGQTEEK